MKLSTCDIRKYFLNFFQKKHHTLLPSSSLVPQNDPSLLFTNAGMNQFKEIFLGICDSQYTKAATAQRCIRAGGKHNDLENVGYTTRHHTFFEMLGNFSFGDYFKQQAISLAWELLTSEQWFALSKNKLWVTVYASDDESYDIWHKHIGIPKNRIIRIGDLQDVPYSSDNFWQMGDTGPCGPCTEIFYDHGADIAGEPPGGLVSVGERYVEIWNIVFMQFNRQKDGSLKKLLKPAVDTGMGLERFAAVLQGVHSNYDIDIFRKIILKVAQITKTTDLTLPAVRVIADHIRACVFLMGDGVIPGNEGRNYILRRIIRRAIRYGYKLDVKQPFLYQLVDPLISIMGDVADHLKLHSNSIKQVLKREEQQFSHTLQQSEHMLMQEIIKLKGDTLSGENAFKLYDTYGLPLDLTIEICREHNIQVDITAFEQAMTAQKQRAHDTNKFKIGSHVSIGIGCSDTKFCGYDRVTQQAQVVGLWSQDQQVQVVNVGEKSIVILDHTPFYAAAGGQVGDIGEIEGEQVLFAVHDTQRYGRSIGHVGTVVHGQLKLGTSLCAKIDTAHRKLVTLNHSATHLLHAALQQILGEHVAQKGSCITAKGLRFDFSHHQALTLEQCQQIEQLVNEHIQKNHAITTLITDLTTAKAQGVTALFDEKYGEQVRVLSIGEFSRELCGGTHSDRTGDIGLFCITNEFSTSHGVRRIEALTGNLALKYTQRQRNYLAQISCMLKANENDQLVVKIQSLLNQQQNLQKKVNQLQEEIVLQKKLQLSNDFVIINNSKLIVKLIEDTEINILRNIVDKLKNELKSTVILLATINKGKVNLVAGVTQDLTAQITANKIISWMAKQIDGKGGGRVDIAQATGDNIDALTCVLTSLNGWLCEQLQ